ncbi:MAG TPA: NAD-dependent epimerase/dehydratase family protein [Steroidobacteraceae bacterium]|nr:NAD-dependent epimerase/dehydratase family protein [Steroidobacteraceae bacterium]
MNSRAEPSRQMNPRQIKVLLFGASGMLGTAVLRECLADPQVAGVVTVGRTVSALHSAKLEEIVHADLTSYGAIESSLGDLDACFFCLGVSSAGLSEAAYSHVTYDYTLAAANTLVRLNPRLTFIYVSGAGTDSSGAGRVMWARVKGRTENALLALPFAAAYMLRPGIIQPLHGIKSKTRSYRIFYSLSAFLLPVLRAVFPNYVLSTTQIGAAMLNLAKHGYAKRILEARDIRIVSKL